MGASLQNVSIAHFSTQYFNTTFCATFCYSFTSMHALKESRNSSEASLKESRNYSEASLKAKLKAKLHREL
jgi:hypothetical protein